MPDAPLAAPLPVEAIADAATFADEAALHALLARARATDPLPFVGPASTVPFWLVTKHADITAIELDPRRFVSAPRQAILPRVHEEAMRQATGGQGYQAVMRNLVAMDGDEHRAYRAISQSHFLSKALGVIRSDIERLAAEFVDRMAAQGGACDFATDVAMWYPLRVIMTILGVPPADEARMLALTQQTLSPEDPEFKAGRPAGIAPIMQMFDYFQPIIARLRETPDATIGSVVANAVVDGEPLPIRDVFGYFLILATAGHDTTSYSLAGGLLALLENPAEFARLRADPSLIPTAVDEMIRWSSPVRHFTRTATEDCTIRGKRIRAGDALLLSYPSANRDEEVFDDPFAFRVDRRPNRHLAFGTGPHLCLGQHLAKLEIAAFLREFLARIDTVELAGEPRSAASTFVSGVKSLPIRCRFKGPLRAAA